MQSHIYQGIKITRNSHRVFEDELVVEAPLQININNEQYVILGYVLFPPTVEFKNHTIQLLDVSYGKNRNYGKEKHYSIKLRVE